MSVRRTRSLYQCGTDTVTPVCCHERAVIGSGAAGVVPGYHVAAASPPLVENSRSMPLPMDEKSGHEVRMFDPVPHFAVSDAGGAGMVASFAEIGEVASDDPAPLYGSMANSTSRFAPTVTVAVVTAGPTSATVDHVVVPTVRIRIR